MILPSDTALVDFVRRIGLGDQPALAARRRPASTSTATMHSLSSGLDFLRFPLLGPWSKVAARGDHPLLLAHPRLAAPRTHDGRGVPGAPLGPRDLREDLEAAAARQARRELPARVGRLHLDLRQAAVLGARRRGAEGVARLRLRRLQDGVRAPARAHRGGAAATCASASRSRPCGRARAAGSRSRPAAATEASTR